jgi:hypothetical protein
MSYMLLTEATFHLLMSALNEALSPSVLEVEKSWNIFDTPLVSQLVISPYVVVSGTPSGAPSQALTAVAMFVLVMHLTQSELRVQVVTVPNADHAV